MKKLILSSLAIFLLAFGSVAFMTGQVPFVENATVAAAMVQPQSPPYGPDCPFFGYPIPEGPYCGTCDLNGKEVTYDCKFACVMAWLTAKNDACAEYGDCADEAETNRKNGIKIANALYDTCISTGGNPVTCKAIRDAALTQVNTEYNIAINACFSAGAVDLVAADAAYVACLILCCVPCPPPDTITK